LNTNPTIFTKQDPLYYADSKEKSQSIPFFIDIESEPMNIQSFDFAQNSKNIAEAITSISKLCIGIFGEKAVGKTTLMRCIEDNLKPIVFTWSEVPGKDSETLIEFLKTNFADLG
jgi:hypothetical protein